MSVWFDSRDVRYKDPFGAVSCGAEVHFTLGADEPLEACCLLVRQEFAGLELIALGCGICYMLSGHHGLYSSQTFVTNKLRAEYMSHKWRVRVKKEEE